MRLRSTLASAFTVPVAAASALVLVATGAAAAGTAPSARAVASRPGVCPEKFLRLQAAPGGRPNVVRIGVTNRGSRSCVVDRIPSITFRGLDGSAQAVPPAQSAPYLLPSGERAYAALRTADPAGTEGHVVGSLSVAADPSHYGVTFGAASVGMARGIRVWEPVTTLWQRSAAAADAALARGTR
ncbi:DUF4232 domain-containing protein [Streptomyces sp. NPDC058231]|uniref:DUF4232 domain-containing protein n=1 Tax=Streptomyces sp. NPDC058231 TaxID=3346392 RepID=UPI0036E52D68